MGEDFETLKQKALRIQGIYKEKNKAKGRAAWTISDYMAGFVGDVGELSEFIMAKKGIRDVEDVDQKLEHELCDCLYSVIVIADALNIDLSTAFGKNMDLLAKRIEKTGR